MATPPRHVVCTTCFQGQDQALKQTFLGFYEFECVACRARSQYPLSTTYRVIYGLMTAFLVVGILVRLSGQNAGFGCGVFSVAAGAALVIDQSIRKKVAHAEANEKPTAQQIVARFE